MNFNLDTTSLVLAYIYLILAVLSCKNQENFSVENTDIMYSFPEENELHEGTWLQWPHHYQYGKTFRDRIDQTWVQLANELSSSENVYIIVYDDNEKNRVKQLLEATSVDQQNIDFYVFPTDDFWVRDNGPIYVYDQNNQLVIQDWGFNGWGNDADFRKCDIIPTEIGKISGKEVVDLNKVMINEGGSVELDGHGTLMACRSSILNRNRNPRMTQQEAEAIFKKYLGATHFVWLEGQAGLEITDQHIDGFARFGNAETIVTMEEKDLLEFDVLASDIQTLYAAKNKEGNPYEFLKLPLTQNNVTTTYGKNLGYKGSYCNYYVANTKVIVPTYNDPNDTIALNLLQDLYPNREVVGIDCRNVYANGGMIHCITQQQPVER